jgi:hypothetical protein
MLVKDVKVPGNNKHNLDYPLNEEITNSISQIVQSGISLCRVEA